MLPYPMYLNNEQQQFLREHCPERDPFCQECTEEFFEELQELETE